MEETPQEKRVRQFTEAKERWLHDNGPTAEMLNSYNGKKFMEEFRKEVLKLDILVPGSFDQTAFNLGKLQVYLILERIQKGEF